MRYIYCHALLTWLISDEAWAQGISVEQQRQDPIVFVAALLLGAVVPFTLVVIFPTNKRLLDPALNPRGTLALQLLRRWGQLHAVRSMLSTAAFVIFLARAAAAGAV